MGKKDTPAAPAQPDPYKTAAAQTQGDIQSAIANATLGNIDTYTPLGSNVYTQTGTQTITDAQGHPIQVPKYSSTQTLSPQQQQLYDQQTALGSGLNNLAIQQTGKLTGLLGSPIDTSNVPALTTSLNFQAPAATPTLQGGFDQGGAVQTGYNAGGPIQKSVSLQPSVALQNSVNQWYNPTTFAQGPGSIQTSMGPSDFSADRQAVVDALNARTQPQLDRQRAALMSSLANQGIDNGSEAWNNAVNQFGRQANDANLQNVLAGSQEQSRLFGLDLSQAQFGNQAQQQGYDQAQGRGLFGLQATNQNNQAALNAGNFYNQAALNSGNFYNQSALASGNFANSAQGQQNSQNAAAAGFNNSAVNQQYSQNMGAAQFGNTTAQQNYQNQQNALDVQNQLALQGATFGNQASAQALQQQLALRNQPINEISSLMSGGQVTMPQFQGYNAPQIAGSSIGANVNQNAALANQQYQAQMGYAGANMAGLYGLGSAALGAGAKMAMGSDRKLKRDIEVIGELRGLPVYLFKYIWDDKPMVGFMADEVEQVMPEAVINIGGYKAVDYGMVLQ
jgi:hypothetical protein